MNQKRINWITSVMGVLFGATKPQLGAGVLSGVGFYFYIQQLQALVSEGIVAGFIQSPGGAAPTSPVVDVDFSANFPSCNAASFVTAISALQAINANYAASYAALVAIKP